MKILVSVITTLIWINSWAQEHPIVHAKYERDIFQRFDNFTMKDGLPSNVVRQIFQDREGFMWLATNNGLCRYDGVKFLTFLPVDGDSTSLSDSKVTSIAQTSDGYLWVGTKNGLNRLDPLTGKFKQYLVQNSSLVKDNYIRALLVCSDGDLWFDTSNATLTRLNPKTFEFHHFSRKGKAFAPYYNHALFETTDKKIWCGSYGCPLYRYDKKSNVFSFYHENYTKEYKGFEPIASGFDDQKDCFWIANYDHHTTVVNKKSGYKTPINKLSGISAIVGDQHGNVWLGGYWATLYKYDPVNNMVTYYEHGNNNPQSLLGGEIYTIYSDRSGVIWVGSDKGLSKLAPYKYKFPLYRHIPDLPSPKSSNIHAIYQDTDEDIWFSTADSALFCFNPNNKTYRNFRYSQTNPSSIGAEVITGISQDSKGIMWFSLWNGDRTGSSINSYNKKTGLFYHHKTSDKYYWYNDLNTYNGQIIIGSWGTGINYFDPKIGDYTKVISQFSTGFIHNGLIDGQIASDRYGNIFHNTGWGLMCMYNTTENKHKSFFRTKDGVLTKFMELIFSSRGTQRLPIWTGLGLHSFHTDKNGLVWDISGSVLSKLDVRNNKYNSYKIPVIINPNSICNSRYKDGFWMTGSEVIVSFDSTLASFKEYKIRGSIDTLSTVCEIDETHLLAGGLFGLYCIDLLNERSEVQLKKMSDSPASSLVWLGNNNILLGGDNGLAVLNIKNWKETKVAGDAGNVQVNSMYLAKNGKVFVSTNNGLIQYCSEKGIEQWWKANPDMKDQLNAMVIKSVTQTPDDNVWVHTDKGISRLNSDHQTFTNYYNTSNDAITSYLVSVICTDRNANTWVGTTATGLSRIDNKTGKVYTYWHEPWDSTSIADSPIAAITESLDGSIWIGTENGLYKYQPSTDNFIRYGEKEGFANCNIRSVKDDKEGNIWAATASGITKFVPTTKQCVNFSWKDGLQSGRFSDKSAARLKDGRLVFGGDEGFNLFDPYTIELNPSKFKALISRIKINDSIQFLSCPKALKLNFNERNIEFSLAYPDFNFPEMNKIEYKLEGFDREFKSVAYGSPLAYTNLSSGTYSLIVRAANNDGIWASDLVILNIEIEYPFWLKWWGILLEILILFGVLAFFVQWRTISVMRKNKRLNEEVERQTQLLHLKNEEIHSQNIVLAQQKVQIQKLYNQISDEWEVMKLSNEASISLRDNQSSSGNTSQ